MININYTVDVEISRETGEGRQPMSRDHRGDGSAMDFTRVYFRNITETKKKLNKINIEKLILLIFK